MNKHLINLVEKWLVAPESVTKDELSAAYESSYRNIPATPLGDVVYAAVYGAYTSKMGVVKLIGDAPRDWVEKHVDDYYRMVGE